MTDIKKNLLRFGTILLIVVPIFYFTQGATTLRIVLYKMALAFLGVASAELVWAVFFRSVYGRTEGIFGEELLSIMVFRGLLYAALILALTLGL